MEKKKHITYWVVTVLLCFCLLGGFGQLFQVKEVVEGFAPLGYPTYFISIIGCWKILAIIALLVPRFPLLKEWAYAGVLFVMTGASVSQFMVNTSSFHIIAPLLITALALCSWYLRPADRRIVIKN
jgi:hypothetical protein